jgi:PAS domain S-box-containing protein
MPQLIDRIFKLFENLMSFLEDKVDKAIKNRGRFAQTILSFIRNILHGLGKASTSLSFTVVILILLLLLIPIILISTTNYFRSRSLLEQQFSLQLNNISAYQSNKLEGDATGAVKQLENMVNQTALISTLRTIYDPKSSATDISQANSTLDSLLVHSMIPVQIGGEKIFEKIVIVQPGGKVIGSSDISLLNQDLSKVSGISDVIGKKQSIAVFNSTPLYTNDLAIFSSFPISAFPGVPELTVIGLSHTVNPLVDLTSAGSFFQESHAYLLTKGSILVGVGPAANALVKIDKSANYTNQLSSIVNKGGGFGSINLQNQGGYIVFTRKLPQNQAQLVLEVPQNFVYKQITLLDPYNLILLAVLLIISGVVVYMGTIRIVSPIVELTDQARKFSEGDLTQRSKILRRDEIGVLAHSFNTMGDQLSDLYQSLESKVEERTRQIRIATDIAQNAMEADDVSNIVRIASELVVEKFGYAFASILLIDDFGRQVVLQGTSDPLDKAHLVKNFKLPVAEESVISRIINQNEAEIIDISTDGAGGQPGLVQPGTRSELLVPITSKNKVIGVMDIQASQVFAFDSNTINVIQTLTHQIAAGIMRFQISRSAEVNLEEANLLYKTTRQINLAKNEPEIIQNLMDAMSKTDYVSALFKVEENYLTVISIKDPKNPSASSTTQGITLPLQRIIPSLNENHLILVENLGQATEFDNILSFFYRRGCRSAALFAIFEGEKLAKILVLGQREEIPFTTTGLKSYADLVQIFGTKIFRTNLLLTIEKKLADAQFTMSLSQVIFLETNIKNLFSTLHHQISQLFGSELGFMIAILNPKTGLIEMPYVYEGNERILIDPFPMGEGLTSILLRDRKPILLGKDIERKAQELGAKSLGRMPKSWMGVPLMCNDGIQGALILQDPNREERFKEDDLQLLTTLAPQVAIAIRNAQILSEIQQTVETYTQERNLLNSWLDNTPDQIYFKDLKGIYLRSSNSYARHLNLNSPEDLIGKSDRQFYGDEYADVSLQEQQAFMESKQERSGKLERVVDTEGKEHWYLSTRIPVIDKNGGAIGVLVIQRDMTTYKQAEELSSRRATQLRTSAEIARDTAGTLKLDDLLHKSVNLVRERFGFYHSSIFLIDPAGQYAILRESTGEAGERMKSAGHRLAVGSHSIIGQVSETGEALVVNNVKADANYYPNPLLPDTQSELAIPLKAGEQILGAMDVQSTHVDAFSDEDISVLRILADQLAIAVFNANLFARTEESLSQHRLLHQITTAAASKNTMEDVLVGTVEALRNAFFGERAAIFILNERQELDMRASAGSLTPSLSVTRIPVGKGTIGQAAQEKRALRFNDILTLKDKLILDENSRSQLIVPILFSNNLLGVIAVESDNIAAFDEEDQEILATLGNNLGAILTSVNLVSQVRRQMERQRLLYDVTGKIRRAVDISSVLQTSANEIGKALGARRAHIEISVAKTDLTTQHSGPGGNGKGKEESK